jgi:hypothetical protein
MGNQQNTSLFDKNFGNITNSTDNKEEKEDDKHKDMKPLLDDSTKNLKGTTSENITTTDYNDKSISNDTTSVVTGTNNEIKTDTQETKVATNFEWREGGKVVYISGSFSNWTHWFIMKKNENGFFELVLDLPRGSYEYKFIVDNKWRYSLLQPTCKDAKGNINNIIITLPPEKEKTPPPDIKEKNISPEELKQNLSDEYTQYFSPKNDLNMDAPFVPYHYSIPFNLECNTNQNHIGNLECLSIKERYSYNGNNAHKNILNTPHVNL